MNKSRLSLLALLIVLAVRAGAAEPSSDSLNAAPEEGLLVLRNGQTLQGRIARSGDRWFVWLPDGEIRVAAADVELFCHNLHEGYLRKQQTIAPSRLSDRLRLAEWCLNHGLVEEARNETDAAAAIDPAHPNVQFLRRRIEAVNAAPTPIVVAEKPDVGATGENLDRFVKKLSPETVALFSQTIQPLLVNRCGMGACHGPQATNRWQLERIPISGNPRQRLTQHNLFATFPFIGGHDVATESLYTHAATAHGGAKHATFGARDATSLQQLAIWLQYAGRDAKNVQGLVPFHAAAAPPAPPTLAAPAATTETSPGPSATNVDTLPSPPASSSVTASTTTPPTRPEGEAFTPADPFDPEIFNRQFGASQP